MKRNEFIKGLGLVSVGSALIPNTVFGQDKPAPLPPEKVSKFVGSSHANFDVVKELYEEFPNLIYCSWDWGGGDFETGIDACGHVGSKDIANFLIDKGARPTLFVLTMLGKTELVKPVMEAYPQLIHSLGPHGFTFLHHAKRGKEDAEELLEYFTSKGLKEDKVSLY